MARRAFVEVRKAVLGPGLSPFSSLVKMALVGWI